jgi:CubicO group peptidase (beta-lactamase class C family)
VKNLATTYTTRDKGRTFVNDMPVYFENWYAAGAMYSTTADLLKFTDALYGGGLLKPASLSQMLKPGLDGYGYGVWIGEPTFGGKQYRAVNRPGGIMGANASLRYFSGIDSGTTVNIVILSNTNATNLDDFSWDVGKALLDRP